MHLRAFFFLAPLLIALAVRSAAAQEWTVNTSDFREAHVLFLGFTSEGVRVLNPDTKVESTIPMAQFVSLQRPSTDVSPTEPDFTLLMREGERLVGEPGPVVNEKLTWVNPILGKVQAPFNKLIAINRGSDTSVPDESPKQDVATLTNGDTVAGVFTDTADMKLTIQADSGATVIPMQSIKRIVFAAAGPARTASDARAYRIELTDGSLVTAADVAFDGSSLKFTLSGKDALAFKLPIDRIVGIEQVNGPVCWLSSLVPKENVQSPYLGGGQVWPARFNRSVDGSPLLFGNRTFDYGIGVHAYSKLSFAIDPQWKAFRTQYSIASNREAPRRLADVTVRILIDGKLVHEEKHFREGVLSPVVVLDLNAGKIITLECDYGAAGDTQAHLDWLQPALLHDEPISATEPATQASTQPATQP